MASRQKTLKNWVFGASGLLIVLLTGIGTMLWHETQQRNAINTEQASIRNNLNSLVIKRPGKSDITLLAENDLWQVHEPCTLRVNPNRLQPLLSIASPAAFSYDAAEVDLEAAGLTQPLATVIANEQRIDIGNTDITGERRYAKRGDRVEFVAEWILPLLDGGLSALAALELFDHSISTVAIESLSDTQSMISDEVSTWQQLTAQQIVPWPIDIDTDTDATLQAQYSVTIDLESEEQRLQVFTTNAYAAIVFENARCAYLLPNDALSE